MLYPTATYKAIPAIFFLSVRYQLPIITNSSFVSMEYTTIKSYILELMHIEQYS